MLVARKTATTAANSQWRRAKRQSAAMIEPGPPAESAAGAGSTGPGSDALILDRSEGGTASLDPRTFRCRRYANPAVRARHKPAAYCGVRPPPPECTADCEPPLGALPP